MKTTDINIRDPFVLCENGLYWLYGTRIFLEQRLHKIRYAFAAILCSAAELSLQQITGQPIIAQQRMITTGLIVDIECIAFLLAIGMHCYRIR